MHIVRLLVWLSAFMSSMLLIAAEEQENIIVDVFEEQSIMPTVFGVVDISNPLTVQMIESSAIQRLKGIDSNGIVQIFHGHPQFSCYEHAIGFYTLLQRYGASFDEALAGLLSCTLQPVSGASIDPLFLESDSSIEGNERPLVELGAKFDPKVQLHYTSYYGYLKRQGIDKLLANQLLTVARLWHKRPVYKMLYTEPNETSLENVARILQTAFLWELISRDECEQLLGALIFENNRWVFNSVESARRIGELSLYLTQNLWSSEKTLIGNYWGELAVRRALDLRVMSLEEAHFGGDEAMLEQLQKSRDGIIQRNLERCQYPFRWCYRIPADQKGIHLYGKFDGINPYVLVHGQLISLTEIDKEYAQKFQQVHNVVAQGVHVALFNYAR